ncbi:MAG: hypothetical protein R8M14_09315 [Ghiorsea sp.]
MNEVENLKDIIKKSVLSDVFRTERAHAILKEIGLNASTINDKTNMSELFSAFSTALQTEALMSVSRIFDPVNNRYPTKSLKQALKFLDDKKSCMPLLVKQKNLVDLMKRLGFTENSLDRAFSTN